jgi:methionyl aminopeptidase
MINIKSTEEIALMRNAGRLTAQCMRKVEELIRPGVTTAELDRAVFDYIAAAGASPSFKGYMGYPASICTSINDEVVHGIPGERTLCEGDIVSIDLGACLDGFHGDMA